MFFNINAPDTQLYSKITLPHQTTHSIHKAKCFLLGKVGNGVVVFSNLVSRTFK